MKLNDHHRPSYEGARYLYATDNGWSADRYAVYFSDGTALVVWTGATHSAWSDLDQPVPHLAGDRIAWTRLPLAVRRLVWERCRELDEVHGVV